MARTKLAGFALSAFLAGVGGCLIGYSRSQVSVESFNVIVGLSVLCMAYVGGITRISGAVVAGLIAPLGVLYTLLGTTFGLGRVLHPDRGVRARADRRAQPAGIAGGATRLRRHARRKAVA